MQCTLQRGGHQRGHLQLRNPVMRGSPHLPHPHGPLGLPGLWVTGRQAGPVPAPEAGKRLRPQPQICSPPEVIPVPTPSPRVGSLVGCSPVATSSAGWCSHVSVQWPPALWCLTGCTLGRGPLQAPKPMGQMVGSATWVEARPGKPQRQGWVSDRRPSAQAEDGTLCFYYFQFPDPQVVI